MYGDCQVFSAAGGGGNGVSSETLFQSSIQNHNNFSFMSNLPFNVFQPFPPMLNPKAEEMGMMRGGGIGKEEMMESGGSGSDHLEGGMSGNEQEADQLLQQPPNKKKRYHRHTAHQIQEMESLFKECPHPDDKQRKKLSQELGLKPRQVKFWFQNRRTQMKAQQDRADNGVLRTENENLKSENFRLQSVLRNIVCPSCEGPAMLGEMAFDEQQLHLENARLKEEFERVCYLASQYCGQPIQSMGVQNPLLPNPLDLDMNMYPRQFEDQIPNHNDMISVPIVPENTHFPVSGLIMEEEKTLALELAMTFMNEIVKMCQIGDPLWVRRNEGSGKEVLNVEEHSKMFPWPMGRKEILNGWRIEASRDTAVVIMNSITLVDAFIDADKWMELFPSIISRAKTLQVITSGVSGHANGSLQLMYAEFQVLSPLVPTREAHFLRYCQQNEEEGTWVIVDFPLDRFHENYPPSFSRYKRRPSGCIVQDMPNGYSRVTWVEHVEVEDEPVHRIFNQFVSSGKAFGAQRWLAVLQRQCERFASLMARNILDLGVIPSPEARKNLMNLAQRMIRMFCINISGSCGQSWTALSDSSDDTVRITTSKVNGPGQPNGLILSAVSTTWLPYPHYHVFDLLRDERCRAQLEVLSNGNPLQEVAHIANGSHTGNCISLLRVNVADNSSQNVELMLQESFTDESGSLVAYTTVDVNSIQLAMNGEDPSCIPLLPLGFIMVPSENDSTTENGNLTNYGSCLLTVGLQVLASTNPAAKLNLSSVSAINNHICNTVHQISAALSSDSGGNCIGITAALSGGSGNNSGGSTELPPPAPLKEMDQPSTTTP